MGTSAQVIRDLHSKAFTVQVVEYDAGFLLDEHAHDWSCFQVVLRGRFRELGTGARDTMPPGTLIYRPAGVLHGNPRLEERSTSLCVRLRDTVGRMDFPALTEVTKPQVSRAAEILTIAADIGRELDRPDDLTPSVVEAQCVQLLGWVVRRSRGAGGPDDRSLTRRARTLIESSQGGQIRVETLAQELNVSRHRLNRAFARTMGCSTGNYLRRLRLLEARRLLEETRIPIAQIALLTGFADQSHLTRQCQAVFGRTPAQLRGQAVAESSTAEAGFDRAKLPNCASVQD